MGKTHSLQVLLFLGSLVGGACQAPSVVRQEPAISSTSASQQEAQTDPNWDIPSRSKAETDELAAFEDLNRSFTETYRSARSGALEPFKTIIVVRFSGASLFRNGKLVETKRVIPSTWHNLRYCAHVPFTLCLKLMPLSEHPLTAEAAGAVAPHGAFVSGRYKLDQMTATYRDQGDDSRANLVLTLQK